MSHQRLARAWLALVRKESVRPEQVADARAFADAVAEHGPHQLALGAVTFEAPTHEALAAGGRVLIGRRREDRFELDTNDGSVWVVRVKGGEERAFEDLDDALSTYYEAKRDTSGLAAELLEIDRHDRFFSGDARAAAKAAALEAEAEGSVGFLPVDDVPEATGEHDHGLTTHPVRTRLGEKVLLEGWYQVASAWLAGDDVCVLCSEGEVELDREDPEVAALPSLDGASLGSERTVRVNSAGLLHVLSAEGDYRYQIAVRAERVQAAPDGRWVAITRSSGEWKTALLAVTPGGLVTLAKYAADIGTLVIDGDRAFGCHGFELLGLDAAIAKAPSGRIEAIHESLTLERPPPPPPDRMKLEEPGPIALERCPGVSVPPPPEAADVDVGWPEVRSALEVGDRRWVLVRLFREHLEIIRFDRTSSGWTRGATTSVTGMDRMFVAGGGRLLILTVDNSPREMAWSAFLRVALDGSLQYVGRLHQCLRAAWEQEGVTYVALLGGEVYALRHLDAALRQDSPEMKALVFDVKGHWGTREFLPRHDHDYGFIDTTGELAIEHQFPNVFGFEGGHARTTHMGSRLFGLVDPDGGVFVPHHYSWIGPLENGFRRIARGEPDILARLPETGNWGLLREDGSELLPPQHRAARNMSAEGFAAVQLVSGGWDLVDRNGELLLGAGVETCGDFSEGLCAVSKGGLCGYVDGEGNFRIEPAFEEAGAFAHGAAIVKTAEGLRFIDVRGRLLGSDAFDEAFPHREGLSRVRKGDRWGFVDTRGRRVIPFDFDACFDFHGGFAGVRIGESWTWVDATGRRLTEPRFDRAFNFHDGVAVFQTKGLRGYMRPSGDVLAEGFDMAYDFSDGLALVQRRSRWGFMDATGAFVIEPQFAEAKAFTEGLAAVRSAGKWGYVNAQGAFAIPPRFGSCGSFSHGRAWLHRGRP